jgi:hypothetical protein
MAMDARHSNTAMLQLFALAWFATHCGAFRSCVGCSLRSAPRTHVVVGAGLRVSPKVLNLIEVTGQPQHQEAVECIVKLKRRVCGSTSSRKRNSRYPSDLLPFRNV